MFNQYKTKLSKIFYGLSESPILKNDNLNTPYPPLFAKSQR